MRDSTIRLDGADATSSNETIGAITLVGSQNDLFGGTVGGTGFNINCASNSVSLVVVPEPGTLSALLGGLMGFRRLRQARAL